MVNMVNFPNEARLNLNFLRGGYELWLGYHEVGRKRSVGQEVIFSEVDDGTFCNPTSMIDESAAQNLMDDLWRSGLRPTGAKAGDTTIKALESHLDDLRRIAFKGLKIG